MTKRWGSLETGPSIQIDRPTRRRVQKLDRKTRNADLRIRCRFIVKVAEEMSRHAAALDVGCAPSTAWWIVDRFLRRGKASSSDGRSDDGERKVEEGILEGIWQILTQTPRDHGCSRSSWILEPLARAVGERLYVLMSVGHRKVVRQLRMLWGRPRAVVGCPWKAARRKRRIAELRHPAENPPEREVVLYADEVDIHLILDNYSIHKSRLIRAALGALGKIRLRFLPPYCPMENRIEREWLDFHANVTRNHGHREMRALMEAAHSYVTARYWTCRGFVFRYPIHCSESCEGI